MWLKSRLCVFISIHGHRHAHLFLSVLFLLVSRYFVLKSFFHLFLMSTLVPDEISMEDPLCNSSFGSMVSLDYVTPDTATEIRGSSLRLGSGALRRTCVVPSFTRGTTLNTSAQDFRRDLWATRTTRTTTRWLCSLLGRCPSELLETFWAA